MTEGGLYAWKIQKIWSRGPTADYSKMSLPDTPEGMVWKKEGKEWRLIEEEPDLKEELVDQLPEINELRQEEDWELLSGKLSAQSSLFQRAGSVRSISSREFQDGGSINSTLSIPFKIQRTASSSTIDSTDNAIGPSGKGVLGVDYVEHVVLPTDTLQGICIAYKVSTTRLRQANHFSGNSLSMAPKKLVIPISKNALRQGYIRIQDTDAKEYKLHAFLAEFPKLSLTEAKAYLELADWVLDDALQSAKEDQEWEAEVECPLKAGQICFTRDRGGRCWNTHGAGIRSTLSNDETDIATAVKPISKSDIPAIATKTMKAEDAYRAASQHDNYGVELLPIGDKKND